MVTQKQSFVNRLFQKKAGQQKIKFNKPKALQMKKK